jgi:hypothetical protein
VGAVLAVVVEREVGGGRGIEGCGGEESFGSVYCSCVSDWTDVRWRGSWTYWYAGCECFGIEHMIGLVFRRLVVESCEVLFGEL